MALWDDFSGMFGGGGSGMPTGYSGLTPDQQNMVNQQGYFMRPDAVMPTGSSLQQPAGYSNLTPDQIQAVNTQGYYTNPDATTGQSQSLWDKLKSLNSPEGKEGIKYLQDAMAAPQALNRPTLPSSLQPYHPLGPRSIYTARQYTPLDPKLALQAFQRGY